MVGTAGDRLLDLLLDRFELEACARLHGRAVNRGLPQLCDFLLDKDKGSTRLKARRRADLPIVISSLQLLTLSERPEPTLAQLV
jgi:hypothetical protein